MPTGVVQATAHYLEQRNDVIRRLGIRAGHLINIAPEKFGMALANRYLAIKESGQLCIRCIFRSFRDTEY
jgi:hypothetical protein